MMIQPIKTSSSQISKSASTNASQSASNADKSGLTNAFKYDDFLKLLVMQLKYQDPLNPMDNAEFATQNAQFSTVEQLMAIRDVMNSQKSAMDTANLSYSTSMIGKEVLATASGYNEAGDPVTVQVSGIVKQVSFLRETGEVVLTLDNAANVSLSDVLAVKEPTPK